TVTVTLPPDSEQPNAPNILNFNSLTNADASKAITINWGPFQGGTSADYISVDIGTITNSPRLGESGYLNGTATSFTLPAGLLKPNTNYDVDISFYHGTYSTNATELWGAFRATQTMFNLSTSSGSSSSGTLVLTNAVWNGTTFSFEVNCSPGQTLSVDSSVDLSPNSWQLVLTTNAPGNKVLISVPVSGASGNRLFRARNGS